AFASFEMGRGLLGRTAGKLGFWAMTPSPALATPTMLYYHYDFPDVEKILVSDVIRQIKAPQALADVVTINGYKYEIRFYLPSQVGSLVGGVYQVSGTPFVTWTVENPDASVSVCHRVRLTETRGASSSVFDYVYTTNTHSWKVTFPGGFREPEYTSGADE